MAKKNDSRQTELKLNANSASDLLRVRSIKQALQTLRVLNCKFAVQWPDGTEEVNGEVRAKFSKASRAPFSKVNDFSASGYQEKIKNMQPGEDVCFEYNPAWNFPVDKWRFAIASGLNKKFGRGMAHTSIVKEGNKTVVMALATGYGEGKNHGQS